MDNLQYGIVCTAARIIRVWPLLWAGRKPRGCTRLAKYGVIV